jgi:very-short-patch-repair endonuclease
MARKPKAPESDLEQAFLHYWKLLGNGAEPCLQHRGIVKRFTKRGKPVYTNHKFDLAFPEERLAVEIEGGIFTGGRHVRGLGYHKDCIKYNLAAEQGWIVLRYTALHISDDPISMINQVLSVLKNRRAQQPVQMRLIA